MDFKHKLVVNMPLDNLWDDDGYILYQRELNIGPVEVAGFLNLSVRYVIADCGKKLNWITEDDFHKQWKEEIKERIVNNPAKIYLDSFPGGFAFIASKWVNNEKSVILLFEKIH